MAIVKGSLVKYTHTDIWTLMKGLGICVSLPWIERPQGAWNEEDYIPHYFHGPKSGKEFRGERQRIKVYWTNAKVTTSEYVIFLMRVTQKGHRSEQLYHQERMRKDKIHKEKEAAFKRLMESV